jgi:hypothetical protein
MRRFPVPPPPALGCGLAFLLIAGCSESRAPDDALDPAHGGGVARIRPAAEVLEGAHIPTLDPARLIDAEIAKALGPGPTCLFRYTRSGRPVIAVASGARERPADAVIKLNGDLVVLEAEATDAGTMLTADRISLSVGPLEAGGGELRDAIAVLEIGDSLRAGYSGYSGCTGPEQAATGS